MVLVVTDSDPSPTCSNPSYPLRPVIGVTASAGHLVVVTSIRVRGENTQYAYEPVLGSVHPQETPPTYPDAPCDWDSLATFPHVHVAILHLYFFPGVKDPIYLHSGRMGHVGVTSLGHSGNRGAFGRRRWSWISRPI